MALTIFQPPVFAELAQGQEVAAETFTLTRDSLVRYAGASGDFNPIHYRDDIAEQVGLEGVLAHGMLTMGVATSVASGWLGTAGFILDAQARFTRPVVVSPNAGAKVQVTASVAKIAAESRQVTLNLATVVAQKTVLAKAQVVVQFS